MPEKEHSGDKTAKAEATQTGKKTKEDQTKNKYENIVNGSPSEYTVSSTSSGERKRRIFNEIVTGAVTIGLTAVLAAGIFTTLDKEESIDHPTEVKMGEVFSQDTKAVAVTVTANNSNHLAMHTLWSISGRTDAGDSYALGLESRHSDYFVQETIFDSAGKILSSKETLFGQPEVRGRFGCADGDSVSLSMHINEGNVTMEAKDQNTGTTVSSTHETQGKVFNGGYQNGQITGVMSDIYFDRYKSNAENLTTQDYTIQSPNIESGVSIFVSKQDFADNKDTVGGPVITASTEYLHPLQYNVQHVTFPQLSNLVVSFSSTGFQTGPQN